MEPKFNTSFIPKRPVISTTSSIMTKIYSTNIFSVIATVFFLVTIIISGGLYFYKRVLTNQINQASSDINTAREALQIDKIQDLIDANVRIKASKNLVEKHVMVSKLLLLLETLTIKNVRFTKFTYTNNGTPNLSSSAEAQTYNALIQQEKIFSENEFIKNPNFSNFVLTTNGKIVFDFNTTLVPDLLSYKKSIEALPPIQ